MTAADYTDTATLKTRLQITDATWDTTLGQVITAASREIDRVCHLDDGGFVGQTLTKVFDIPSFDDETALAQPGSLEERGVYGQVYTLPPEAGLLSVTTLKTDEDGDGVFEITWTATTDYLLYPLNQTPSRQIVTNPVTGRYAFPVGLQRLQIAGSWGDASTVPDPIREATLIYAARLFMRRASPFGVLGDQTIGYIRLQAAMDVDVQVILRDGGFMRPWRIV